MNHSILLLLLLFISTSCVHHSTTKNTRNSASFKKHVQLHEVYAETSLSKLIERSQDHGKTPILYFYADWCPPCKGFKKSLSDERVVKEFDNALLLGVDIDADPHDLSSVYSVHVVPTYIKLGIDSTIVARITSAEWEEDIAENIAPVMKKLISQTDFDVR